MNRDEFVGALGAMMWKVTKLCGKIWHASLLTESPQLVKQNFPPAVGTHRGFFISRESTDRYPDSCYAMELPKL